MTDSIYTIAMFAATWIDVQPLIGGDLLVWVYDNDTIKPTVITTKPQTP